MSDEQRPERSQGHDLIFLSVFPMGLVSDRSGKEPTKTLHFRVGDRELTITGSDQFGLPTPTDIAVMLCLLEETIVQGCPERVEVNRYQLLRRLGWQRNSERYERVRLALKRLHGTSYYAINHYPDPKGKRRLTEKGFHLLISFQIHESHDSEEGTEGQPKNWIAWSPEIRELLVTKQLKQLDLQQYLDFRSAITQSLYRYLHTRRMDGKPRYEEGLETLCFERLGLSRSYTRPAKLKQLLDSAHDELLEADFLRDVNYERTADGKGWKVVYSFPPRSLKECPAALPAPARSVPQAQEMPADPLTARLVKIGISQQVAARLVAAHRDEVERQLAYWPFRDKPKNPAGALRQAICEAWEAPGGWLAEEKHRAEAARTAAEIAARKGDDQAVRAQNRVFDAYWETVPPAEQEQLMRRAADLFLTEQPAWLKSHWENDPKRRYRLLRSTLMTLIQRMDGEEPPSPP